MQSRNTENKILPNKVTTQKEHLQILNIIHFFFHFSNRSTETKMGYFYKDDNIPGTHRPSELFFMLTYIYSKYLIVFYSLLK